MTMNRRKFLKTTLSAAALTVLGRFGARADGSAENKIDISAADTTEKKTKMIYRPLGKTGKSVSVIALGIEGFRYKSAGETKEMIDFAFENGINFIDVCLSDPVLLNNLKQAVGDRRNQFVVQGHIGTVWENGQYRRSRDLQASKTAYNRMLDAFGGRIDVGMFHYVDDENDFDRLFSAGIVDYARQLKNEGKIESMGISTHSPVIGRKAVESGIVDVIMFSSNLGYDLNPGKNGIQYDKDRLEFYELCARRNIAIDVMKPYGGGNLLNAEISPFGKAFTPVQALNYVLTRPGVAAAMVGCQNVDQIAQALAWCGAFPEQKDYAREFREINAKSWIGHCLYCGHCAPCPQNINIADINKYLNLALAQTEIPATVKDHYRLLKHHAGECIQCGVCETRCPFHVSVREKMKQAVEIFGY